MARKSSGSADALPQGLSDETKAEIGFDEAAAEIDATPEVEEDGGAGETSQETSQEGYAPATEAAPSMEASADASQGYYQQQQTVPLAALHEAREIQKELRARHDQALQEKARYEERLAVMLDWMQLQQQMQNPAQQPAPPPDPNEDPFGHIEWLRERVNQQEQTFQQFQQQYHAQQQQIQQAQQQEHFRRTVSTAYDQDAQQFAAQQAPDYQQAVQFLGQKIGRELAIAHGVDPNTLTAHQWAAIDNHLQQQLMMAVVQSFQAGDSPARRVYAFALEKGYVPQGYQEQQAQQQPAEKLKKIASAQAAHKSLSGVGSSANMNPITLQDVASADDEQFEKFMKRGGGKDNVLKALMGL